MGLPTRPNKLLPLSLADKQQRFGRFTYVRDPQPDNPEHIKVTGDWATTNLVNVQIPQLVNVAGANGGLIKLHKLAVPIFQLWFHTLEDAGLLPLILGFGGAYSARLVRGSTATLSSHAHGSAVDLNVAWNQLGKAPAPEGAKGSVAKLVPIAASLGIYWGGWFSRLDGMHFELGKLSV